MAMPYKDGDIWWQPIMGYGEDGFEEVDRVEITEEEAINEIEKELSIRSKK